AACRDPSRPGATRPSIIGVTKERRQGLPRGLLQRGVFAVAVLAAGFLGAPQRVAFRAGQRLLRFLGFFLDLAGLRRSGRALAIAAVGALIAFAFIGGVLVPAVVARVVERVAAGGFDVVRVLGKALVARKTGLAVVGGHVCLRMGVDRPYRRTGRPDRSSPLGKRELRR